MRVAHVSGAFTLLPLSDKVRQFFLFSFWESDGDDLETLYVPSHSVWGRMLALAAYLTTVKRPNAATRLTAPSVQALRVPYATWVGGRAKCSRTILGRGASLPISCLPRYGSAGPPGLVALRRTGRGALWSASPWELGAGIQGVERGDRGLSAPHANGSLGHCSGPRDRRLYVTDRREIGSCPLALAQGP